MDSDVEFVRLSTKSDDEYLLAADDGRSVCLDACQASYNAVWAVERRTVTDYRGRDMAYVLLRGVYGRYLGSSPCLRVGAAQVDFDEEVVKAILWKVITIGDGVIQLESASGSFLEYASKRFSSLVTRDWMVDKVRPILDKPEQIDGKPKWVNLLPNLRSLCSLEREVYWVLAETDGTINESYWGKIIIDGTDTASLEKELARLVVLPTTLCIRAGRYGQPTPLCVNLPRSKEALHVVLFLNDTPGGRGLRYPYVHRRGSGIMMT